MSLCTFTEGRVDTWAHLHIRSCTVPAFYPQPETQSADDARSPDDASAPRWSRHFAHDVKGCRGGGDLCVASFAWPAVSLATTIDSAGGKTLLSNDES